MFCLQIQQYPEKLNGQPCLNQAKLYGKVPNGDKFLTIGIPSVDRKKGKYLAKTLKSLIVNLEEHERDNVTIIVLIGDTEKYLRSKRANETLSLFQQEVDSGLILIIEPIVDFYPVTKIKRRTFNDSLERIQWRSKQVLDFAFLFHCTKNAAEYFLILEDDVEASPGYARAIHDFVSLKQDQDWISLTFSGFYIIGRLLKDADLQRLSDFLVMFHLEKPVDLLILQYLDILVQNRYTVTRRIPGLFQHVGLFSSLGGKIQKAKDVSFSSSRYLGNPPADIVTTLGVYKKHFPENCYTSSTRFFWGSAPSTNDTLDVVLHRPIKLKKLSIISGHPSHKNDVIRYAELKLSPLFKTMATNKKANCSDFQTLSLFEKGAVNINVNNISQVLIVQCIRIEFIKRHPNWVLIREILVRGDAI